MPDPGQWKTLEGILHEHPAKWMIWEGEPIKEVSRKLHAMEIKSIVFDPCCQSPARGDFITAMHQNMENLVRVFK